MSGSTYMRLQNILNFLLDDHAVSDFGESTLDIESFESLHAKADALCSACGGDPATWENKTLAQLQPKLDFLLQYHEIDFDDTDLDPDSLATVEAKLTALYNAHANN
ncbi:MAG: hypothetical protein L0K07_07225 [Yaniella sp.]|uniref:hypothetical protein n=1 Tax=Yaniella sp. TaxID=2773929 RepID=UPI0026485500|nr:hypothetical protein [Yaniella sp.]MDN5816602.1 hypothetical protein [Yaniella sp.]MDN6152051.1 hypothetical protein [Yaniella sp.]MDN6411153.1 hypothetical protein [Yaniella sp.]MDN6456515.1 hypothetical protein [Yaniella sp.]MDN6499547.1 hypothetical protein [Yaniella sp.]